MNNPFIAVPILHIFRSNVFKKNWVIYNRNMFNIIVLKDSGLKGKSCYRKIILCFLLTGTILVIVIMPINARRQESTLLAIEKFKEEY